MAVRQVLLLGNPQLYETAATLTREEIKNIKPLIGDLHDTLMDFKERYGAGRAIASPQIGVMKRVIYMHIHEPVAMINPRIDWKSSEMMEVWDDCMCFPDLLVKVVRHQRIRLVYLDLDWEERSLNAGGDLSELLQHECDHLDGILAVSRAIDGKSFALRNQRGFLS